MERWNHTLPRLYEANAASATWGIGLHFAAGGLLLVLGPTQLIAWIRQRWLPVHRWIGRLFVTASLLTRSDRIPATGDRRRGGVRRDRRHRPGGHLLLHVHLLGTGDPGSFLSRSRGGAQGPVWPSSRAALSMNGKASAAPVPSPWARPRSK